MFVIGGMILAAGSVMIDPGLCRQVSSGRTGAAVWNTDGQNHLSVSLDAPSKGEVSLYCRVPVPAGTGAVTLSFDRTLVSFQPAGSRAPGSGLLLAVGDCGGHLLRVAGEDWIEARLRRWVAQVVSGRRGVEVRVIVRDVSDRDPVRIDLTGLRLTIGAEEGAERCR